MKILFLFAASLLLASPAARATDDYTKFVESERKDRVERLTRPNSWLSLIGLHYLKTGANTVGSAADNQIVLDGGPAHFGVLDLAADGTVHFTPGKDAPAHSGDKAITETILLPLGDDNPNATLVTEDTVTILLIERGGRKAIRVKDSASQRRKNFTGIEYFPIDTSWRIEATWVPTATPQDVSITNIIGNTYTEKSPGKAVFTRDGKTYELTPIVEEPGDPLFFIFADATSGNETYGMRFMDGTPTPDGKIILDFNLAENPPCAFTSFATCPLPPKGNILTLAIPAGEKVYQGEHH